MTRAFGGARFIGAIAGASLAVAALACSCLLNDLDGLAGGVDDASTTALDGAAPDVSRGGDAGVRDAPAPDGADATDACPATATRCGGQSACVELRGSDKQNCGGCGKSCPDLCALGVCHVCTTAAENTSAAITCPSGTVIRQVVFASYGLPTGVCGAFTTSTCDAPGVPAQVNAQCVGQASCSVPVSNAALGGDPCVGAGKVLVVEVACAP